MTTDALRSRVDKLRLDFVEKSSPVLRRPAVIKSAELLTRFILSYFFSGAVIFGGYAPFGAGMVAASGAGLEGLMSLLGVALGSFTRVGIADGLKYVGPSVLIYAAAFIFGDTKVYKRSWFMPAMASLMAACTGFVYMSADGFSMSAVVFFLTDVILIGGSAYFYRIALSPWWGSVRGDSEEDLKHTVSLIILIMTGLVYLYGVVLPAQMSLGRLTAALFIMLSAYKGGMALGCVTGCAAGVAMDAAAGGLPICSMAYTLAGLVSGSFKNGGRLLFALSYIVANTIAVLWTYEYSAMDALLYEAFCASVIFTVLPDKVFSSFGAYFYNTPTRTSAQKMREHTRHRVEQAAAGFLELYDTARSTMDASKNDNDFITVFDGAAERVCRKCVLSGSCWHRNYISTLNALNDASPKMLERGSLEASDLPEHFTEKCAKLPAFIDAANEELKSALYRRQYKSRLRETQRAVCNQYSEMYVILKSIAYELGQELNLNETDELLAATIGIASVRKKGESVSGDSGSYFKSDDGKLYVILSDGMGSGRSAARESETAVRILERFLLSGIEADTALGILNSVMLFKSDEDLSCATVDLLCTDLRTGEASLFKYGAAPSYLKRGKTVTRIVGETMAAGLCFEGSRSPDKTTIDMRPGDFAIIASDGVASMADDEWLVGLSAEWDGDDTKELSRLILEKGMEKYGVEDDMTVVALRLEKRRK